MDLKNMGDLLSNAGKMRKDLDRVQEDLKNRVVEGSTADGEVTVLVNGQQEVLKVTIDPKVVSSDPDDVEILEDLILAAIAQGVEKSKKLKSDEMSKVTGGLDALSGLF